jgi:hypothetical protein
MAVVILSPVSTSITPPARAIGLVLLHVKCLANFQVNGLANLDVKQIDQLRRDSWSETEYGGISTGDQTNADKKEKKTGCFQSLCGSRFEASMDEKFESQFSHERRTFAEPVASGRVVFTCRRDHRAKDP